MVCSSVTAQGIADAFTDAELCAAAVDQALTGSRGYAEAMADYQARRDQRALPMYELTCEFATLQPPSPQLERLLVAVHGNPDAMDAFARTIAGTMSPADFFAEKNVERIFAAAAARGSSGLNVHLRRRDSGRN
jgi:2-polyprenyl-6-methoxyphenol hydroxylase-like FAD-dependent oxidoreductase